MFLLHCVCCVVVTGCVVLDLGRFGFEWFGRLVFGPQLLECFPSLTLRASRWHRSVCVCGRVVALTFNSISLIDDVFFGFSVLQKNILD